MAADLTDTIGELRDLLHDMRQRAEDTGYGLFPGGDPRTFTPDPECSTAEERQAWRDDCARVERGEEPVTKTRCEFLPTERGAEIRTPGGYGFGTYVIEDPDVRDFADRLERCIAQLDGYAADNIEEPDHASQ